MLKYLILLYIHLIFGNAIPISTSYFIEANVTSPTLRNDNVTGNVAPTSAVASQPDAIVTLGNKYN